MHAECDRCAGTTHQITIVDEQSECKLCIAEDAVIADVRRGYPNMPANEALDHVLNTVNLDDIDGDDELSEAYLYVITHWTHLSR